MISFAAKGSVVFRASIGGRENQRKITQNTHMLQSSKRLGVNLVAPTPAMALQFMIFEVLRFHQYPLSIQYMNAIKTNRTTTQLPMIFLTAF
jgi:hypothetical protein